MDWTKMHRTKRRWIKTGRTDPNILSQYSGPEKRSYNLINTLENACQINRSLDMFNKGYASSSLNLMRSTLNFFFID